MGSIALIVPRAGTRLDVSALEEHCKLHLGKHKRPRSLELVTELPKTISGKIRRVQLRRLEHDNNRGDALRGQEFREDEFPELQKVRTAGLEAS